MTSQFDVDVGSCHFDVAVVAEYGEACQETEQGNLALKYCNRNKAYVCTNNRCVCTSGYTYYAPQTECVNSQGTPKVRQVHPECINSQGTPKVRQVHPKCVNSQGPP